MLRRFKTKDGWVTFKSRKRSGTAKVRIAKTDRTFRKRRAKKRGRVFRAVIAKKNWNVSYLDPDTKRHRRFLTEPVTEREAKTIARDMRMHHPNAGYKAVKE